MDRHTFFRRRTSQAVEEGLAVRIVGERLDAIDDRLSHQVRLARDDQAAQAGHERRGCNKRFETLFTKAFGKIPQVTPERPFV
jgi:hypothetical protein